MFLFHKTPLAGVVLIEPEVYSDARGRFFETYSSPDFVKNGIGDKFVQSNHSTSSLGVLRGLHFQRVYPQAKLVRVAWGAVYDVAVDLREDSQTYGCYFGAILSGENAHMLYIPAGCAHGFLSLAENTEFVYQCSDIYRPEYDAGIRYDDPRIDIRWPFAPRLLSQKDAKLPNLEEVEQCGYLSQAAQGSSVTTSATPFSAAETMSLRSTTLTATTHPS